MRFDCKFKHLEHSDSLVEYTESRFQKIKKFELKPTDVHITFSEERHKKSVEVYIKGLGTAIRASAYADNFNTSVDKVLSKVLRQMEKEKKKINFSRFS